MSPVYKAFSHDKKRCKLTHDGVIRSNPGIDTTECRPAP